MRCSPRRPPRDVKPRELFLLVFRHVSPTLQVHTSQPEFQNLTDEIDSLQQFSGERDRVNTRIAALEAANAELVDQQEMAVSETPVFAKVSGFLGLKNFSTDAGRACPYLSCGLCRKSRGIGGF